MRIDWSAKDWSKVDMDKAEFIYREAQMVSREVIQSHNVLNDKAFRLLSLVATMLVTIGTALVSQWGGISIALQITGVVFLILATAAVVSFSCVVWPRDVQFSAAEPDAFFVDTYYRNSLRDILHGSIMTSVDRLDAMYPALMFKRTCLRAGVVFLVCASTMPALVFIGFSVLS